MLSSIISRVTTTSVKTSSRDIERSSNSGDIDNNYDNDGDEHHLTLAVDNIIMAIIIINMGFIIIINARV